MGCGSTVVERARPSSVVDPSQPGLCIRRFHVEILRFTQDDALDDGDGLTATISFAVMLNKVKHLDVDRWDAGASASSEPIHPPSLIRRSRVCASGGSTSRSFVSLRMTR